MIEVQLKNNKFEAIKVTGNSEQFSELKKFCGDKIRISYESCSIDDYWLIQVYNPILNKWEIVPDDYFIVKIDENIFIVLSNVTFNTLFKLC